MTGVRLLFLRETAVAARSGGALVAVAFYLAATVAAPLAIGPSPGGLGPAAAGLGWVALILASLLSLDQLYERDFSSGALDQLALGEVPLEMVATIKCLSQWVTVGMPLAAVSPVGAVALGAPLRAGWMIAAAAAVGGLAFAFVGGAGAALALASRRGGVLIALIVLPLLSPAIIFGGAAVAAAAAGGAWEGPFALLCGYALAAGATCPFAMAGACRSALD